VLGGVEIGNANRASHFSKQTEQILAARRTETGFAKLGTELRLCFRDGAAEDGLPS